MAHIKVTLLLVAENKLSLCSISLYSQHCTFSDCGKFTSRQGT